VKTLRERASTNDAASADADILSYYRRYARDCEMAAKNARNEKQRSALRNMLPAWNDFAEKHERMIRDSVKQCARAVRHGSIKGWM
jgi:hypothetical protein